MPLIKPPDNVECDAIFVSISQLLDRIAGREGRDLPSLQLGQNAPVALLVNSLGATTAMELLVAAKAGMKHARHNLKVRWKERPALVTL